MSKTSRNKEKICYIAGVIVGTMFILLGMYMLSDIPSRYVRDISFGADFYTEIYSAVRTISYTLNDTLEMLLKALSWFFILFGGADICFFLSKIIKLTEELKDGVPESTEIPSIEEELPEI